MTPRRKTPLVLGLLATCLLLVGCRIEFHFKYSIVVLHGGESVVQASIAVPDIDDLTRDVRRSMREAGYLKVTKTTQGEMATLSGTLWRSRMGAPAGMFSGGFYGSDRTSDVRVDEVDDGLEVTVDVHVPLGSEELDQTLSESGGLLSRDMFDIQIEIELILPGELVESNALVTEAIEIDEATFTRAQYVFRVFHDSAIDLHLVTRIIKP